MNLRSKSIGWRSIAPYLLLIACLILFVATAFPQATTGDISGIVVDKTNSVIPNAKVVATHLDTNKSFTAETNANGEFRFGNLPVGNYTITASAKGFKATVVKDFPVELNKTASARMELEVGEVNVTVEVTDTAATIDTTTDQLGTTFDTKLQDYPTVAAGASGVLNLSLLQPGVASSGGIGAGSGPSIGGQRPRNNNFTIDGIDDNDKTVTGPSLVVPNDAVQEFTVLENVFSPEFGHSNGGQFNQVVKSGTNSFHGTAYEYLKNRNLNAIDATTARPALLAGDVPKNPRFDNNRFGGNFGGPILKNKAFFFVNYEYNPIGQAFPPAGTVLTPTSTGYNILAATPGVSATNLGVMKQFVPAAPNATSTVTVAGATIPVGALPINAPNFSNTKTFVVSGDYDFNSKDRLTLRDIYNQTSAIDIAAELPVFFTPLPTVNHFATIQEVHTFTPAVLNEFRLGFHRTTNSITTGNFAFPGLDVFPNIQVAELNLQVGPDPNGPQFAIQNVYQAIDNVSWNKGNHSFKFGTEFRKYISPQQFTQRSRGDYDYSSLDLFLRDLSPDQLGERSTGNSNYYGDQVGFYWFANDNWKIRRNLSLNLGVRYEYTTVPFTERLQTLNQIANVPGVMTFGEPHYPKNAFAPRVGFAYTPGADQKMVVRGGISMGYDVLYDNIGILSLPPEFGSTIDVDVTNNTPNFLANGGIHPGGSGLTTFANAADAIAATSNHVVEDIKLPTAIEWTLGVQRSFGNAYTVEVRYVGTHAYHLNMQEQINRAARVTPSDSLPTYLTAPSQATLDASTITLASLLANNGGSAILPAFANAGFTSPITQFTPLGSSIYHGLSLQVNRRFTNGLQFQGAYTFSHAIDNSTADFFSTVITPRRQQDFQNVDQDRSNSALDHRNRFTFAAVYDVPWYKHGNWFMKNMVGNWQFTPIYTYETGEWGDVQSGIDSNLNGDTAGDRAVFNSKGVSGTGSGVTPLCTSSLPSTSTCGDSASRPFLVGYLANNGNAQFITAGLGAFPNAGRNGVQLPPIDNVDLSIIKRFAVTERVNFEFGANFQNLFNHPQFIAGLINDVASFGNTTGAARSSYLNPADPNFLNASSVFSSNSRTLGLVAKIKF
ncbi:MAG TPA: carboxypeptidase regulatory-like domain-containing protein [Candidatus Angelobacter sp.]|nr:carboxypeptidase regulatory-like domain-containing protein [Candidatus Angelobacter sp.]